MMKRISLLLALVMLLALVPKASLAEGAAPCDDPFEITEVIIEGFTVPAWGEHPDYEISVPEGAHYSLTYYDWNWEDEQGDYDELPPDAVFDNESLGYYMYMNVVAEDGYFFSDEVVFLINGTEEYVRFMFPERVEVAILTTYFYVENGGGFVPGDVDLNGAVETADALLALRNVLHIAELDDAQLTAADVDGDGRVSVTDAVVILRLALGLMQ